MSGHFLHETVEHGLEVPEEWLPLSSAMSEWTRSKSGVMGISVGIHPGCRDVTGAPAAWNPDKHELLIDPSVALPGQDPASIDFGDALWQNENPSLYGLAAHEIGHAIGTRYTGAHYARKGATPRQADVLIMLEEPNAEAHALERIGRGIARYLRHTALEIALDEFAVPETRYGAGAVAILSLARADIGVLGPADAAPYQQQLDDFLGAPTVAELRLLWQRFLRDNREMNIPDRIALADRWLEVIGEDPHDPQVCNIHLPVGTPAGEPGGGGGEAGRTMREQAGESDRSFVRHRGELREKRAARAAQQRSEVSGADGDLDSAGDPDHGGAGEGSPHRASFRTGSRSPSAEERRGMVVLADGLAEADFRGRAVSRGTSEVPPGRLRSSAMAMDAARDLGIPPQQTDIFAVKKLRPDIRPPLTVGLMTDVSGSMSRTVEALCTTQWMFSNAVDMIQGRIASMFFGVGHYRGLRVGERHDDVDVWRAQDGFEMPYPAFRALDAQLDLLHGTGARLLVIATDARWSQKGQVREMHKVMAAARSSGLHVLWATFTGWTGPAREYRTGAVVDLSGAGPVQAAGTIGSAVVDLVRSAGS